MTQCKLNWGLLALALIANLTACSSECEGEGGSNCVESTASEASGEETQTTSGTPTTTTASTTGSASCGEVPTEASALADWLRGQPYAEWARESAAHDSRGPHFGDVRVFVNECMAESLAAQSTNHPLGSVAVKELFGTGSEILGYSVMVKVDGEPDGSWYWYERYQGMLFGDGVDDGTCTGCHALGVDSVRSLWPFE